MKTYIYVALAVLGGLSSCASSLEVLSYEQLIPAQVSYPEEVEDIAVVNTLPPVSTPVPGIITVGQLPVSGKDVAEQLAGLLADSKYFGQVIISDSVFSPVSAGTGFSRPEIQELVASLSADMIFALQRAEISTRKMEIAYPGMPLVWPVIRMTVRAEVGVYSPMQSGPVKVLAVSDSLDLEVDKLTSDRQLQDEAAKMATEALVRALVPHWGTAERLVYSGGCVEMRDADIYVKENDWKAACEQWNTLYKRSKAERMKFRAAFNSALGYEMLGDTSESLKWLGKAKEHVETGSEEEQIVKLYETQLLARMKELGYLSGQMNRFEHKF